MTYIYLYTENNTWARGDIITLNSFNLFCYCIIELSYLSLALIIRLLIMFVISVLAFFLLSLMRTAL